MQRREEAHAEALGGGRHGGREAIPHPHRILRPELPIPGPRGMAAESRTGASTFEHLKVG